MAIVVSVFLLTTGSLFVASAARTEFMSIPDVDGLHLSLESDLYLALFK